MALRQFYTPAANPAERAESFVGTSARARAELRVLSALLHFTAKNGVSVKGLRIKCGVSNPADVILSLREKGLDVTMELRPVFNKFGEETTAGYYTLTPEARLRIVFWLAMGGYDVLDSVMDTANGSGKPHKGRYKRKRQLMTS